MKRLILSVVFMALTIASVASVMTRPASADLIVFTATLLPSNEVPPITNADQNASGTVTVTLDTSNNSWSFNWTVNGLGASQIILSHIHEAPAGVNGPVRVDSNIGVDPPFIPIVSGGATFFKAGIIPATDAAGIASRVQANPAGFYFNVHTNINPGGAVRGQLVRQQAAPPGGGTAPTLSEWGAILMGLLLVAACVFFIVGRHRMPLAVGGAPASSSVGSPGVVDWKLLAKVTLYVEAAIALALIALSATATDAAGALTSGLVVAFIVHEFVRAAQRR
jgi:CHRD domain/IPTL-CTERM motif